MAPAGSVMRRCAAALLATGLILLGPAPAARACTIGGPPTERVPVGRATAWERRVGVPAGPGYVAVPRYPPLPATAVMFYGTATAAGQDRLPDPHGDPHGPDGRAVTLELISEGVRPGSGFPACSEGRAAEVPVVWSVARPSPEWPAR